MIHAKQYLGIYLEKVTVIALGKKWTVLLHKGAVPNVLEFWAVLHIGNVRAFSLAQEGWATFHRQFVDPLANIWAFSSSLQKDFIFQTLCIEHKTSIWYKTIMCILHKENLVEKLKMILYLGKQRASISKCLTPFHLHVEWTVLQLGSSRALSHLGNDRTLFFLGWLFGKINFVNALQIKVLFLLFQCIISCCS